MRGHLRVALLAALVVACLVAVYLPQASAGRHYKRRCDLVGCQRCYTTPARSCYGRGCQEMYACEENKCGEGYIYNDRSGMCDCKQGHGIVLGRCSYKTYRRKAGFSAYYAGIHGYNQMHFKQYTPKSKAYGPRSFGYRHGMYVSGPYCRPCLGGYSPGGEPMTTFCIPQGSLGTIQVQTQPTGTGDPFDVDVTFNVPGGCSSLATLDVMVVSTPDGITCESAEVDSDCKATTSCTASKPGTFKLRAQLQGVVGIMTDSEDVVVPDTPQAVTTVQLIINIDFDAITAQQRTELGNTAVTLLTAQLASTGVDIKLVAITQGSVNITIAFQGTPQERDAARAALARAWAVTRPLLARQLSEQGVTDSQTGELVTEASLRLLLDDEEITPPPSPPPPPPGTPSTPPPPFTAPLLAVVCNASVDTRGLTPTNVTNLQGAVLVLAAAVLASESTTLFDVTAAGVSIRTGAPLTIVAILIACPPSSLTAVIGALNLLGIPDRMRSAVWQAFGNSQFDAQCEVRRLAV